jgi:arylsulfatase
MNDIRSFLGIGLASLMSYSSCWAKLTLKRKPNVVIILMDDMGLGDIGSYGAIQYNTPNIDKLAATGMRFTSFYAAQPVSTASRVGLLTGCYPNRLGMFGALAPNSKIGLNPDEKIIPEMLKKQGYKTAAFGKWGLGDARQFMPLQRGFDEYLGLLVSNDMWPVYYDGTRNLPESWILRGVRPELFVYKGNEKFKDMKNLKDQSELTTLYTEYAINFINQNKKNPFFLYLAHSMPHVPLAVSDKFKGKSKQGLYGDVCMELDWSVGQIVKTIKKDGLTDNTLIIFMSDNGPWLSFGNHAGSTGGLREGKFTPYEGGMRVPCIMKWPGVIPEGLICNKLSCNIDILPTIAKITNSPLPKKKIDGVNILSLLLGNENANPRDELLYYYGKNSMEAIRKGKWKLVFAHRGITYIGFKPGVNGFPGGINTHFNFPEALYDLRRDPGERYDVKEYYPEVVTELEKIADSARIDLGDDIQHIKGQNRREPGRVK